MRGAPPRLDASETLAIEPAADTPGLMRRLSSGPHGRPHRRVSSLAALSLFLLGTNFCVFAPPPSLSALAIPAVAKSTTSGHGCCGAAREQAARDADATRQVTAPCCVAVAPVLAGHGATVDPAPALPLAIAIPTLEPAPALVALEQLALAEDERPPALHSATPEAGRAPPRL